MSRRKKDPLREFTEQERQELSQLSRSQSAAAAEVDRARLLLAVARGDDYQDAARSVGRRSGDAVSRLVSRFNAEGVAALTPRHGGGRRPTYDAQARARIAAEARREPTPERDGTATWSLTTLQRTLRGPRRPAPGLDLHDPARAPRVRGQLPAHPDLVPHRPRPTPPQGRAGGRHRPGRRREKKLIEDAYRTGEAMGLTVWCTDQAGPYQTIPYAGQSWRPAGDPGRLPHEYLREGTAKALTLFHPADGRVRLEGVTTCPNSVLHPWLKRELAGVLAAMPDPPGETTTGRRAAWDRWQEGLTIRPTLPDEPPTLRMLLVLDNLAGHKTPELVCWLFEHGVMPLYTPVGGSWLNMAESLQRILKRRALDGRYPTDTAQIIAWFEAAAAALGRGADALSVGRQADGAAAAATRAPSRPWRLGGLLPRPGPATHRFMATGKPSDPLERIPPIEPHFVAS